MDGELFVGRAGDLARRRGLRGGWSVGAAARYALSSLSFIRPDHVGIVRHADRALAAVGTDPRATDLRLLLLATRTSGLGKLDIAGELFLSRNTVQTHVSHILASLGAQSRAGIIREARQHPPVRDSATA